MNGEFQAGAFRWRNTCPSMPSISSVVLWRSRNLNLQTVLSYVETHSTFLIFYFRINFYDIQSIYDILICFVVRVFLYLHHLHAPTLVSPDSEYILFFSLSKQPIKLNIQPMFQKKRNDPNYLKKFHIIISTNKKDPIFLKNKLVLMMFQP